MGRVSRIGVVEVAADSLSNVATSKPEAPASASTPDSLVMYDTYDVNGAITPIRRICFRARVVASDLGTKPISSMHSSIRALVFGLTRSGLFRAFETVEMLTPAARATS